MDNQWLTPRPLRSRNFQETSPGLLDAGSLEVCAASSTEGVVTKKNQTCITPDEDVEDKKGLAIVAAVLEIFDKRKKKRDKKKQLAKKAVMNKEGNKKEVTIKDILKGCNKTAGAEEEKTKATGGSVSDDEMGGDDAGSKTSGSGNKRSRDDKNTPMDGSGNDRDDNEDNNRDNDNDSKDGKEADNNDNEEEEDNNEGDEEDKEKEKRSMLK